MSKHSLLPALAAMAGILLGALPASAHPHVWVTMRAEVVYAPDGKVTGIRHAWTFDDMFSAFAIQGLDEAPKAAPKAAADPKSAPESQGFLGWLRSTWAWLTGRSEPTMGDAKGMETKGKETKAETKQAAPASRRNPTREQLHPLAQTNVESLKDFDYFTIAKVNGKRVDFLDPPKGYYLDFQDQVLTLHFTLPLREPMAAQFMEFAVYDPSYFVDFSFEKANAARLVDAPQGCQLLVARPEAMDADMQAKLFAMGPDQKLDPSQQLGEQFSNRILVKCP